MLTRSEKQAIGVLMDAVRELLLRVRWFLDHRESGHALGALVAAVVATETALVRFGLAETRKAEKRAQRAG